MATQLHWNKDIFYFTFTSNIFYVFEGKRSQWNLILVNIPKVEIRNARMFKNVSLCHFLIMSDIKKNLKSQLWRPAAACHKISRLCNTLHVTTKSNTCPVKFLVLSLKLNLANSLIWFIKDQKYQTTHFVLLSLQQSRLVLFTGRLEGVIPLFQHQVTLLHVPEKSHHQPVHTSASSTLRLKDFLVLSLGYMRLLGYC